MEFHIEAEYTKTSPEDALTHKMPIGKYKGQELQDIVLTWHGRRYLEYMQTTSLYPETLSCVQEALKATPDVEMTLLEAGSVVIRFGQYRDLTMREICRKKGGIGYLRYINSWDKCSPELLHATDTIIGEFNKQQS